MDSFDVRVAGCGIVGRAMALVLARQGLRVAVTALSSADAATAAPRPAAPEVTVLRAASVALLREIKVWDALPAAARTAVREIRVSGDTPGAGLHFSALAQRVPELAWVVDVGALQAALDTAARFAPGITAIDAQVSPPTAALTVVTEDAAGHERAHLGARFERHGSEIGLLTAPVQADLPHGGVAWQWLRGPDSLALLPCGAAHASTYILVWPQAEALAQGWAETPAGAFDAALNEATAGSAGRLWLAGERAVLWLAPGQASAVAGPGWVLAGEAAQVPHPLAGRDFNLGLADVTALAAVLARRESWRGPGDAALLRRYARGHLWAAQTALLTNDGPWRFFCHDHPWMRELRNRGMTLLDQIGPLKRWLASRALEIGPR